MLNSLKAEMFPTHSFHFASCSVDIRSSYPLPSLHKSWIKSLPFRVRNPRGSNTEAPDERIPLQIIAFESMWSENLKVSASISKLSPRALFMLGSEFMSLVEVPSQPIVFTSALLEKNLWSTKLLFWVSALASLTRLITSSAVGKDISPSST